MPLDEVKARVYALLEAFPENYGRYHEADTVPASLLAEVPAAKAIASLPDLLGLDSFKDY